MFSTNLLLRFLKIFKYIYIYISILGGILCFILTVNKMIGQARIFMVISPLNLVHSNHVCLWYYTIERFPKAIYCDASKWRLSLPVWAYRLGAITLGLPPRAYRPWRLMP